MWMWEVTNTGTFCQDGKSKICQKRSSKVAKAGKPGAIEDAKAEALLRAEVELWNKRSLAALRTEMVTDRAASTDGFQDPWSISTKLKPPGVLKAVELHSLLTGEKEEVLNGERALGKQSWNHLKTQRQACFLTKIEASLPSHLKKLLWLTG